MKYQFKCPDCGKSAIIEIPINKYEEEKNTQICSNCNSILSRVIEWEGSATNLGGYSDIGGKAQWQS